MRRSVIPALSLFFFALSAGAVPCTTELFIGAPSYPVAANAGSIVTADFNGDGFADVATLSSYNYSYPQTVSVLLGNADGTFQPVIVTTLSDPVLSFTAGLFDADGNVDLVLSRQDGNVTTLPGNGDGTFKAPVTSAFPPGVGGFYTLKSGNIDGNATLDLVGLRGDPSVSILLGNGDGTFSAPVAYGAGVSTGSVALGDVNGDNHVDLVVGGGYNSSFVAVLLGAGDGTFGPPSTLVAGVGLRDVQLADLDGDGNLDIAVASGTFLAVLLGNGDGSFQAAHDYAAGANPTFVRIADFNGDGLPDAAIGNQSDGYSPPNFWVLEGQGDGTFVKAGSYTASAYVDGMAIGAFGTTAFAGLAVASGGEAAVSILLGNGDGTLQAIKSDAFGTRPTALAGGDFNGDGFPDLAVVDGSTVRILLGDSRANFSPGQVITFPNGVSSVASGGFTSNGTWDLIASSLYSSGIVLLVGNGDGTFAAPVPIGQGSYGSPFVLVADFNGDGFADFAVTDGTALETYLGIGNGTFQPPLSSPLSYNAASAVAADLDGDGIADVVLADGADCCYGTNEVSVLLGHGDGTFAASVDYPAGAGPVSVAVADVDGDGHQDLAVANVNDSTVSLLPGLGDGTFGPQIVVGVGFRPRSIVARDFDGDGHVDLVTSNRESDNVTVFRGLGGFQFESPVASTVGGAPLPLIVTDLYANNIADVVVGNTDGLGGVSMLISPRLGVGILPAFGACVGTAAHLQGNAAGFGSVAYQWLKNGNPLSDGGAISGAATRTLTIDPAQPSDDGSYELVVTDSCTTVFSNTTSLTVDAPPAPPAIGLTGPVAPGAPAGASVFVQAGHTYFWTVQNAVILTGQGSAQITFLAFMPGTMTLQVVDYSAPGCGTSSGAIQVPVDYFDVPPSNPFHDDIVTIARAGITAGCGGGNYCPTSPVTRAQMAVFLLKADLGSNHIPPVYPQFFNDVPPGSFAYDWINELYVNGVTNGCGNGDYCPGASVTRAQMAVFLLKTLVGGYYNPPYPPQIFGDVAQYDFAANFIADLYGRAITGGCSASPLLYCPGSPVNRGQMATFLVRTFPIP